MSPRFRWLLVALSTPLVIVAAVGGLIGAAPALPQKGFEPLRVFEDVVSLVTGAYVQETDPDKIMEGAMKGLVESLDPESAYLPPAEVAMAAANAPLPAGDTGLIVTRQFWLRVIAVRDGSPAARAGLRSGDYVRSIDDTPTRDMSSFTGNRLLRGAVGSKVKVTIVRGNAAEPHEMTLTREPVSAALASGAMKSGVGYLRVASLADGASIAVRREAEKLQQAGARALVIDIRGVADGTYEEAMKTAQMFLSSGVLATRGGRDAAKNETINAQPGNALTIKTVVLQSFGTSGPAEVFAAAMSGNKRAELVGERTAGLAAEQHLVRLPDNFGLWLTYRKYYTTDGQPILEHGVAASVNVEEPSVDFGDTPPATDVMLERAIERAKS